MLENLLKEVSGCFSSTIEVKEILSSSVASCGRPRFILGHDDLSDVNHGGPFHGDAAIRLVTFPGCGLVLSARVSIYMVEWCS